MTQGAFSGHCERFEESRGNLKCCFGTFSTAPQSPIKSAPQLIVKILARQESQIRLRGTQQPPKTLTANQRCSRSLVNEEFTQFK